MERIYVKGLGVIEANEANKPLLIKLGLIKDDTINTREFKPNSINTKRVKSRKSTK